MKIVTRGVGEKIIIDGHLTVTVKQIEADQIVLAIESTRDHPPYREHVIALEPSQTISTTPLSR